jgi:hypothetical protein
MSINICVSVVRLGLSGAERIEIAEPRFQTPGKRKTGGRLAIGRKEGG